MGPAAGLGILAAVMTGALSLGIPVVPNPFPGPGGARWPSSSPDDPRAGTAMAVWLRLVGAVLITATAAAVSGWAVAGPLLAAPVSASRPPRGWVLTTDPPSGLSIRLPRQPSVHHNTGTDSAGQPVAVRQYLVTLSDGRSVALFQVAGALHRTMDLDKALRLVVAGTGIGGTVTSSRRLTVEGHPAVEARYTTTINGSPHVVFARFIGDRGYLVLVETNGPLAQENALKEAQQQILSTLHLI